MVVAAIDAPANWATRIGRFIEYHARDAPAAHCLSNARRTLVKLVVDVVRYVAGEGHAAAKRAAWPQRIQHEHVECATHTWSAAAQPRREAAIAHFCTFFGKGPRMVGVRIRFWMAPIVFGGVWIHVNYIFINILTHIFRIW